MKNRKVIRNTALMVVVLYAFLLSIKLMGSSFKLMGKGLSETLIGLGAAPLISLLIGIFATSIVQSSSATTSLIVGLVAADSLPLTSAIFMIMGANIGTSVTNTLVSIGHITQKKEFNRAFSAAVVHDFFNLLVVLVLFPLELLFGLLEKTALSVGAAFNGVAGIKFSGALDYVLKPLQNGIITALDSQALVILALALTGLFASLYWFTRLMRPLMETEFKHYLHNKVFRHPLQSFTLGAVLTILVQSSSVTTSLIVPLVGVGALTLRKVFPYTLGANIGTTITALLAALATGSPVALTVAIAHLFFNVYGVVFVAPFYKIPIAMAEALATMTQKSRMYSLAYIGLVFFALPGVAIFLTTF